MKTERADNPKRPTRIPPPKMADALKTPDGTAEATKENLEAQPHPSKKIDLAASQAPVNPQAAALKEFGDRVREYVSLHEKVESKLPSFDGVPEDRRVRPADDDGAGPPEEMVTYRLGKGAVANLPLESDLELRVAPRDRVPHHHELHVGGDVLLPKA